MEEFVTLTLIDELAVSRSTDPRMEPHTKPPVHEIPSEPLRMLIHAN